MADTNIDPYLCFEEFKYPSNMPDKVMKHVTTTYTKTLKHACKNKSLHSRFETKDRIYKTLPLVNSNFIKLLFESIYKKHLMTCRYWVKEFITSNN